VGLEDNVEKALDAVKKVAADVKDALTEAGHRSAAEGERAKRDVAGDEMTAGEKLGSVVNEAKESTLADVDRLKREVRDS
jgi:hypothetical protein